MCMKKPGPRCYNAVMKKFSSAYQAFEKAPNGPERLEAQAKIASILKEADGTKEGVARLATMRDMSAERFYRGDITKREVEAIAARHEAAQEVYRAAMRDYDVTYGKVDGKAPAKDWSDEAYNRLQEKFLSKDKAYIALGTKLDNADPAEAEIIRAKMGKVGKEMDSTAKRMNHVTLTKNHVQSGLIPDPTPAEVYAERANKVYEKHQAELSKEYPDHGKVERMTIKMMELKLREDTVKNGSKETSSVLVDSKGKKHAEFDFYVYGDTSEFTVDGKLYTSDGTGEKGVLRAEDGSTIAHKKGRVPVYVHEGFAHQLPSLKVAHEQIKANPDSIELID